MTRASAKRVAKRTTTKKPEAAPGNGAQPTPADPAQPVPPPTKKVGSMDAGESKKLSELETVILNKLAEHGDIGVQIDAGREKQRALAAEVLRLRQDRQSVMRGIVLAHGLDPDKQKFHLDLRDGAIRTPA